MHLAAGSHVPSEVLDSCQRGAQVAVRNRQRMEGERRLQECSSVPTPAPHMTWLYFAVPLMIAAMAIAWCPSWSGHSAIARNPIFTSDRGARSGTSGTPLGHHTIEDFAPTPDLVRNGDTPRVEPDDRVPAIESTLWLSRSGNEEGSTAGAGLIRHLTSGVTAVGPGGASRTPVSQHGKVG